MTAAKPPARQRAVGALANGFATAELHHQAGHDRAGAGLAATRSELAEVRRRIDGMIRAIEEGLYERSMKARMQGLERRREALEAELATAAEPKPRLHPGPAEIYRAKVAGQHDALAAEDGAETREALRALVEAIVLVPEDGVLRIELRGDLAAILALGQNASTRREGRVHETLLEQVSVVAGARNPLGAMFGAHRLTADGRH